MDNIEKGDFFKFARFCRKYVDVIRINNLEKRIGLPNSTLKHAMCGEKSRSPKKWVPQTKEFFLSFFAEGFKLGLFTFEELKERTEEENEEDLYI